MRFKKIGSRKIYIEVIEQIKNLIDSGEIKPGDQLPSERDLAEYMGISRVSVRQALAVLEAIDVVDIKHGEGTFVSINKDSINNLNLFLSNISKESDPIDIIDARKIIEVEIAGVAAKQRDENDLLSMRNLLSDMQQKIEKGEQTSTVDLSFHLRVAESTH
ncbi:MAG TPA: FadR/GntR family transcriptional regulator, partial [bacterium]|nr:FadR/GntR family transcriptional regulator [bacterium]